MIDASEPRPLPASSPPSATARALQRTSLAQTHGLLDADAVDPPEHHLI